MFCMNCGTELPDNAKFCINCGTKVQAVSIDNRQTVADEKNQVAAKKGLEFLIGDEILRYNEIQTAFFELEGKFHRNAFEMSQMFADYYGSRIHDLEAIFSLAIPYIEERLQDTLRFGHKILNEYGVNSVSLSDLEDEATDRISIDRHLEDFIQSVHDIQNYALSLESYRNESRSNRSYWQGGGFGLGGAIKGAVTAGALNIGTGLVRGMLDGITNKRDRNKIIEMQKRLFNRSSTFEQLSDAVIFPCLEVRFIIEDILIEEGKLQKVETDSDNVFSAVENKELECRKGNIPVTELISAVCDGLRDDPTARWYYSVLYLYSPDKAMKLEGRKLAEHFGMGGDYSELARKYDIQKIQKLKSQKCLTVSDIEAKISELKKIKDEALTDIDFTEYESELMAELAERQSNAKEYSESEAAATSDDEDGLGVQEKELEKIKENKLFIDGLLEEGQEQKIWNAVAENNSYAEYVMLNHYKLKCEEALKQHDYEMMEDILQELQPLCSQNGEIGLTADYIQSDIRFQFYCNVQEKSEQTKKKYSKRIYELAESGNIGAMAMIGFWGMHRYHGMATDDGKKYLLKASELRHPTAMAWLGSFYRKGYANISQDKEKAKELLTMAAEYGHPYGIEELQKMSGGSSSSCYITTAVCSSFGKPDDCYELEKFREYRDCWLSEQPKGGELIKQYYRIAPEIVSAIDNTSGGNGVYFEIWEGYLRRCLQLIEDERFYECRDVYEAMVRDLETLYLSREEN